MVISKQKIAQNVIPIIFFLISSVDVLTQYSSLSIFGYNLHFFYTFIFFIFAFCIKIKKNSLYVFIVASILLIVNYRLSVYSEFEFLKMVAYFSIYLFIYVYLVQLTDVKLPPKIILLVLIAALLFFIFRYYLYVNEKVEYNYNWTLFLLLSCLIILATRRSHLFIGLLILMLLSLVSGARGMFLIAFSVSIVILLPYSFYKKTILRNIRLTSLLFSIAMLIIPILLSIFVSESINADGRIETSYLSKSGLSGRELGYSLYFDYLSDIILFLGHYFWVPGYSIYILYRLIWVL